MCLGLKKNNNVNLILFKTKKANMPVGTYFREVQIDIEK